MSDYLFIVADYHIPCLYGRVPAYSDLKVQDEDAPFAIYLNLHIHNNKNIYESYFDAVGAWYMQLSDLPLCNQGPDCGNVRRDAKNFIDRDSPIFWYYPDGEFLRASAVNAIRELFGETEAKRCY